MLRFISDCGYCFNDAYFPLVLQHRDDPYTQDDVAWQRIRRGRYVEFNLVCDRGTKFGLRIPSARVESILMSLPRDARWVYEHVPEGRQKDTVNCLKHAREWIELTDSTSEG